jgi:hypothetical protein
MDRDYGPRRRKIRLVSTAAAKNLEAISKAIDQHNSSCPFPASEVRMNPFEVERLGWEEIRGLPIVPDSAIGTGRFRIVCSRDGDGGELEETEAIGEPVEVPAAPAPSRD